FMFGQLVQKESDGIVVIAPENINGIKKLKLKVWCDNIIQVISSPTGEFSTGESLIITGKAKLSTDWNVTETENQLLLSTISITAKVDKNNLRVGFFNKQGQQILTENNKEAQAAKVVSEDCFHIKQSFLYSADEMLYGLGSFQNADVALNGKKIALLQKNRDDVVPVIISTNHYGLLWDNYSYSEFNDTRGSYYLWSEVADQINYFFIYGENIDSLISSYRQLTGKAPMYPKWVFGYIQSKQKYNTQEEIVSVVKGFRDRKFPLDVIVQDWQYWPEGQWGQKSFNRKNYPDPAQMVNDIHNMNAKIIISIWPNMTKGTPDQLELVKINGLLKDNEHLNVFMPEARQMYWKQADDSLFSTGIDGWWADCSEGYDSDWTSPFFKMSDTKSIEVNTSTLKDMMGSGRYINTYALMHTKGLYEGQRSTPSQKRVYILTRSSFAGMQKYGASYWTGDVSANWEEFRMQIPAGLNFCMTGIPYWTTDIAGYFIKHEPGWWFSNGVFEKGQEDEGFKELYTRWFQFAAFCPLFRAHGADFPREPWTFGNPESITYKTLLKFTNLRYHLIPYIYSLAWKVTNENYTIMRTLPFDFMNDSVTYNINNQYMFGPSIMVSPVVEPLYYLPNNVKKDSSSYTRDVYLPKGVIWFDFWTGKKYHGNQQIKADASYETMPLFIKAGSIIPFGPMIQYSTEKCDTLEIRIYPGRNGEFTLYEDENDNYNYEKGIYSLIKFYWDDTKKTLTISDRRGTFPGMLKERTFTIVLVDTTKGTGCEISREPNKVIHYTGNRLVIRLSD
ncbi:MAG: glycoside hydrolase family 31 protein, partial [Bacteroidota bacterium]